MTTSFNQMFTSTLYNPNSCRRDDISVSILIFYLISFINILRDNGGSSWWPLRQSCNSNFRCKIINIYFSSILLMRMNINFLLSNNFNIRIIWWYTSTSTTWASMDKYTRLHSIWDLLRLVNHFTWSYWCSWLYSRLRLYFRLWLYLCLATRISCCFSFYNWLSGFVSYSFKSKTY